MQRYQTFCKVKSNFPKEKIKILVLFEILKQFFYKYSARNNLSIQSKIKENRLILNYIGKVCSTYFSTTVGRLYSDI